MNCPKCGMEIETMDVCLSIQPKLSSEVVPYPCGCVIGEEDKCWAACLAMVLGQLDYELV